MKQSSTPNFSTFLICKKSGRKGELKYIVFVLLYKNKADIIQIQLTSEDV